MKNYRQLIKELPSKSVVFAFGRFNPPTTGHELLVKAVKKLATQRGADHAIYASKSQDAKKNPLSVDKKVHYLNLMFPRTHFVAANAQVRTFIEAAKELNKKYKNLIMVAGSDRIPEYEKLLNKYNGSEFHFDTIQVVSAGERDPDADDASGMSATKMRSLASKGDYATFKTGLPSSMRDIDGKRLMNDIRSGMGLEAIKENVKFDVDSLREKYHKGQIYHIGQFVESNNQRYEILDRGSNYLVLANSNGDVSRKWIQDVTLSENQIKEDVSTGYAKKQITFKGYTTKNFDQAESASKAFQDTIARSGEKDPVAVLNALKSTDAYMAINDRHLKGEELTQQEVQDWNNYHEKAKESLDRVGEFMHHEDYWHMHRHEIEGFLTNYKEKGKDEMNEGLTDKTLKSTDKIKVARMIATILGIETAESSSNPESLVNNALRKVKTKALNAEALAILDKMLVLATEVGIDYDATLKPNKLKEATVAKVDTNSNSNLAGDIMSPDDKKKLGHSVSHGQSDTIRKMKIKHMSESQTDDWKKIQQMDKGSLLSDKPAAKKRLAYLTAVHNHHRKYGNDTLKVKKEIENLNRSKLAEENSWAHYAQLMEDCSCDAAYENQKIEISTAGQPEQDVPENEIDELLNLITDDDIVNDYDEDELAVIDPESGDELEFSVNEQAILEVLSRIERMKAKFRMRKTEAKRERAAQLALRRHSNNSTINKRARRLAIKTMKKRILRGRDMSSLSVGEKERIERMLQNRKAIIGRVAMKLVPRIRQLEKSRLSHDTFTKAN